MHNRASRRGMKEKLNSAVEIGGGGGGGGLAVSDL